MTDKIQRGTPMYLQIVKIIRDQIESGELVDGAPVPSEREMIERWEISKGTANKVTRTLKAEGLVRASPGHRTVVDRSQSMAGPKDWMASIYRTGLIYGPDETSVIKSAEVVPAPDNIADAMAVEPGSLVIRRCRVTYRANVPIRSSTSWFDGALIDVSPLLLGTERIPAGTGYIAESSGRWPVRGRDQCTGDTATEQEASDLGIAAGSPVHRYRTWLYDGDDRVIEYGEFAATGQRWVTYEYNIVQKG